MPLCILLDISKYTRPFQLKFDFFIENFVFQVNTIEEVETRIKIMEKIKTEKNAKLKQKTERF